MLLTIRNLTEEPIAAYTHPSSLRTRTKVKALPSASEFLLQPSLDFITTLPKGIRRELILWNSQNGPDPLQPNSSDADEKAGLLDKWHTHPEGFKIQVSVTFAASWQLVKVPQECPWRVYINRVCTFPRLQLQQVFDDYDRRLQEVITNSLFYVAAILHRSCQNYLTAFPYPLCLFPVCAFSTTRHYSYA